MRDIAVFASLSSIDEPFGSVFADLKVRAAHGFGLVAQLVRARA